MALLQIGSNSVDMLRCVDRNQIQIAAGCGDEDLLQYSTGVTAGAVDALIPLLRCSHAPAVQHSALLVLSNLALSIASSHTVLLTAGAVPLLIEMMHLNHLHFKFESSQDKAVAALCNLSSEDFNSVTAARAIGPLAISLLQILQQSPASPPSVKQDNQNRMAPPPPASANTSSASPSTPMFPNPAAAVPAILARAPSSAPAASAGSTHALSPASAAAAEGCQQSPAPAERGTRQSVAVGKPKKQCWSCGATGVPLKKCSVCTVAAYCGAGCQKADWKAHKGQCAGLKADTVGGSDLLAAAGEK